MPDFIPKITSGISPCLSQNAQSASWLTSLQAEQAIATDSDTLTEAELKRALQQQEFVVFYEPIVLLSTGILKGVEARVYWQHPARGMICPTEFIPLAEQTGFIIPLTYWILYQACAQAKYWHDHFPRNPPLTVSVNISPQHFCQPQFISEIQSILNDTGLDPMNLKLEITQCAIMDNQALAIATLKHLKELDIQSYLDHFGTEYSSLTHLFSFPIDTVKIDRIFIQEIHTQFEQFQIVQSILKMAWSLGMNVIAEGIETLEQLSELRLLRCDYGQGYFFSKPLDSKMMETQWLQAT